MGSDIPMQGPCVCKEAGWAVREASQEAGVIHWNHLKALVYIPALGSFHGGLEPVSQGN